LVDPLARVRIVSPFPHLLQDDIVPQDLPASALPSR
jgi:hypothetical protein